MGAQLKSNIRPQARPEVGPIPPQAVHPRLQPSPTRGLFEAMAFAMALFLVSLFFVWTRTEVVKATYELGQLQGDLSKQIQTNDKLTLELLTLKAPDRLVSVAVQKLGMQPPGDGQVRVVK